MSRITLGDDLLERLLSLADREGALAHGSLEEFSRGLRERARLVVDDRVRPLEARVAALESELAARSEAMRVLAAEKETLVKGTLAHLDEVSRGLGWGSRRARETVAALAAALRKELQ